ncbi:MAG: ABC transporter ATP-binding protein [Ignavibacteriales bacterium]|jgi:ABC-type spermidine/putrescine transport systems, ATPase components|nr:Spermidine/putrescine import ATP-binding protein PotA [Ignavibacteria bacterium]MCC6886235.1 ABC transporter ATP-binding protein [Ignavibacteriales bacterium]
MPFVSINNVSKEFESQKVLDSVSLEIVKGEFFSLVGPSGCGKTTLLRIISGLETPTSGKIILDGNDITSIPAEKRNIGIVFQNYALFPHMSVFNNIAYGLKIRKFDKSSIKLKVEEVLRKVKMSHKQYSPVTELSGGEQQRVSLARVIVNEPELVLFDEPLSNLDYALRLETRKEIKVLQQNLGITSIYVTHDQSEALALSDRIAVMNNGVIMQTGKPEEVYNNPVNQFTAEFIGHYNIFSAVEFQHIFGNKSNVGKYYAVLPEKIIPVLDPEGLCTVESVQFNGFFLEVQVQCNNTRVNLLVTQNGGQKLSAGDRVHLALRSNFDFRELSE